jgi:hypothetical protein
MPGLEWPDLAVGDREARCGSVEARGAKIDERFSRRRGRLSDFGAAACETGASPGAALVRALSRVAVHNGDAVRGDAKFFGGHLCDRDADAGPDIHLAREDRDRAVRMDRQKTVDL